MPEAAVDRLAEPLGDLAERRRVLLVQEAAHRVVLEIGVEQLLEMMVADAARGGREGEQVVDRRGDLEAALVAVPHDAGDPLGIGGARSEEHTSELQSLMRISYA